MVELARLLESMGDEAFSAAWPQTFLYPEAPLEQLRDILKTLQARRNEQKD
jgi:hypothetical protein